jgi:hypothetical protein
MLRFASESVSNLVAGIHGGTAVYLGDRRWITCRHVLGDASTIKIDANTTAIRVLRGGDPIDGPEGDVAQLPADWVIFEAQEAAAGSAQRPACYDPDLPVAPGQEVYLIGYPCLRKGYSRLSLVRTRAASRPFWLPKGLLYLSGPTSSLGGLSGGAAVVMHRGEVVMLGIFHGHCRTWWPEWPRRALLAVVRPPK